MKVVVVPSNCFDSSKPQGGWLWSSWHRPLSFPLAPGFLFPTAASYEAFLEASLAPSCIF